MIEAHGLVDTNVFIHAHTHDTASEDCRRFLGALEAGSVRARLEPVILHELSYALPRYLKQMTRTDVAAYLLMVLAWDGIEGDKDVMVQTVESWRDTAGVSFADAFLAASALTRGCPVYSKNVGELTRLGATVPNPLPTR